MNTILSIGPLNLTPYGLAVLAGVLAGAAGQKLGEIQNIDYSWGHIDFEFRPMDSGL